MNQTPNAHTGRRTQGVTEAALGAVARLGGNGPQNVGDAQGNKESKKRKGPGCIALSGRDFDLMRFGCFCERAAQWLSDARAFTQGGMHKPASKCVAAARKNGQMARAHYAAAMAAGKGVAA